MGEIFVSVCSILVCGVDWFDSPVILALSTTVQVYVVPLGTMVLGGLLVGEIVKAAPLQIVEVCEGIRGLGFTVTITVNVGPVQLPVVPDLGVTV